MIALEKIGTHEIIPTVLQCLGSSDRALRICSVKAFRNLRDKSLNKILINLLSDKDSDVRGWAALILGEWGENSAIKLLIRLLKDANKTDIDSKKVKEIAFHSLEQISKKVLVKIIL